ncbi:MAG: hypothetical protein EOP24_25965 [Hyphomicrobiales bacterium]|nr:MAG: hypothetical protein EOP24_25965 [Hyphomicrobiales bacterium]
MIATASDLLGQFLASEVKNLAGVDMKHMPTLGSAYEAITKAGIDQRFVLPPGLDLRVVSGFIEGLPNQYDCLLVQGEGRRYGLTDQYLYPIERVLCVLEVKKTLTKAAFADAIEHLAEVQKQFLTWFGHSYDSGEVQVDFRRAGIAFERITARKAPETVAQLDGLDLEDRMLFAALARQIHAPVTVVFGFEGYTTEAGLRTALVEILEGHLGKPSSASVDLMPTLVTSNSFSLVKCNNQPYLLRRKLGEWIFVASTRHNPARLLLELLWSKISNFCDVRMPWGPDMELETLKELLSASACMHQGAVGWKYGSYEYRENQLQREEVVTWEPPHLSRAAMAVASLTGFQGGRIQVGPALEEYVISRFGVPLKEVLNELLESTVFTGDESHLHVIASSMTLAEMPDGTGFVAGDREKLERWCEAWGVSPVFTSLVKV